MNRAHVLTVVEVATSRGLGCNVRPPEFAIEQTGKAPDHGWAVDVDLSTATPDDLDALRELNPGPVFSTGVLTFGSR